MSDFISRRDPLQILKTQREAAHVHEEKVADKNTSYRWGAAPVRPPPSQPLAKRLDITRRFGEAKAMAIEAEDRPARELLDDFIKTEGLDRA